jgi:hypothetical protein
VSQLRKEVVPDSKDSIDLCPKAVGPHSQVEALTAGLDGESLSTKGLAKLGEAGDLGAAGHDEAAENKSANRLIHDKVSRCE